jgi:DNA-binding transcriptional regulator YiaG
LRLDHKMRQADLAAYLGVSDIGVRQWERRGDNPLPAPTVTKIAPKLAALHKAGERAA